VDSLKKLFFTNLKIHHRNTIFQKNHLIFEIMFCTIKVATTTFSGKFTMFQKSFYMFKTPLKKCGHVVFFVSNVFFTYQMFTKSFQFFCELSYIPQEGIHMFKTFKK
jgi:hypothetical protein